jgi:deazaflavin-dependent oxidoreductase (nitroreductase family)
MCTLDGQRTHVRSQEEIEAAAVDSASEWARRHIRQYLESDGRDVDHPSADRMILLYTTGRRSGTIRRVPLVSFPDDAGLVVVASHGGAPRHPQWFRNLEADPDVWVRRRDEFYAARAVVLEGEEHERQWSSVVERTPAFGTYQEKAGRQIPLVRLERREP